MDSYEQRKQDLIAEITAAFDGVGREGGVSLHEAMVIDNYGSAEERAEARAQDTEARWQDVPDEDIGWSDAVLSFLDPIGFRYYIPAFMVWHLKYADVPNNWNDHVFDSVVSGLAHRDTEISQILTPEQSGAIARFLVFEAEREAKCRAEYEANLEEGWKRWLANGEARSRNTRPTLSGRSSASPKILFQRMTPYAR